MYHYLGNFQLYETSTTKHSEYRCPCKIDGAYFDCQIKMVNRLELCPGESVEVQICFLSIDLVAPCIKVDNVYQLYEGSQPIGEMLITQDPWYRVETWVSEGEIRKAIIDDIGWTRAKISVEGGIIAFLGSEAMGLKAWEEISLVLKSGESVRVRIEKIDKVSRNIKVSFVDRVT
jgi:hypothetical protein